MPSWRSKGSGAQQEAIYGQVGEQDHRPATHCRSNHGVHPARPAGFDFRAGQYAEIVLTGFHTRNWEGNSRTFSLASAPFEKNLQVAMCMNGSEYKRLLADCPLGTKVELRGPAGDFELGENGRKPAKPSTTEPSVQYTSSIPTGTQRRVPIWRS